MNVNEFHKQMLNKKYQKQEHKQYIAIFIRYKICWKESTFLMSEQLLPMKRWIYDKEIELGSFWYVGNILSLNLVLITKMCPMYENSAVVNIYNIHTEQIFL